MSLLTETSQLMTIMAVSAIALAVYRWPEAKNRALLGAFILVMLGTIVREIAVLTYGVGYTPPWPWEAQVLSAIGRLMKVAAAILFVREATHERYGEWMWSAFLVLSLIGMLVWR